MYWTARQWREFFWESWFTKRDEFHRCVTTLSYRVNAFMTGSGIIIQEVPVCPRGAISYEHEVKRKEGA